MRNIPISKEDHSDYGDVVDWESDAAGEIEINAEPVEKYLSDRAYYPVSVGDVLDGRYQIVHKLGHGGFSTVWMAQDRQKDKLVALKILVSGKDGDTEFHAQEMVKRDIGKARHIVLYYESFSVPGNRGSLHRVLVMPLLGPNLEAHFTEASMTSRMSAVGQLLIALKALHRANIVHRDLNMRAVMWQLTDIRGHDRATQYQHFGRPQKLKLDTRAWKSGELVSPMIIPPGLVGNYVFLGDLGMAIRAGASVDFKPQTPAIYCAPERYHGCDPSFASDMWSFMVIFATLYLGFFPFYAPPGDRMAAQWANTLGPLPLSWKGRYCYPKSSGNDAWYDQKRKLHPKMSLLSKVARRKPAPGSIEIGLFLSILKRGFSYRPEERMSAEELLQDGSFNALMRIYGCDHGCEAGDEGG